MSGPISASSISAARLSTPGIVSSSSISREKGRVSSSIRSDRVAIVSSRKSICASICPTSSAWWPVKRPWSASRNAGIFLRSAPLASSARTSGSWVPEISASSICRADTPSTSEATEESLIPASCKVFSTRWTSRRAFLDLGFAVADQVAQLAQRPGRHEARADQPVLDQLAAPLGVLNIALATGDVTKWRALNSWHSNSSSSR